MCIHTYMYIHTHMYSDKGHSERGQTSKQRTNQMYRCIQTLYKTTSLQRTKCWVPKHVHIERFHCTYIPHTYIHTHILDSVAGPDSLRGEGGGVDRRVLSAMGADVSAGVISNVQSKTVTKKDDTPI